MTNFYKDQSLNEAIETIDAAIFTGDTFTDFRARRHLFDIMGRWTRGLDRFTALDLTNRILKVISQKTGIQLDPPSQEVYDDLIEAISKELTSD